VDYREVATRYFCNVRWSTWA